MSTNERERVMGAKRGRDIYSKTLKFWGGEQNYSRQKIFRCKPKTEGHAIFKKLKQFNLTRE